MIDYASILLRIRPGAAWELIGDDYSGLVWHDDSPKPTKKTLDDAWAQTQHDMAVQAVQEERQARYRAESDPLFFEWQRGEEGATKEAWEAKIAQIRAELPYPTMEA